MKKIYSIFTLLLVSLTLFACADARYKNTDVVVSFFTFNGSVSATYENATIDPITGLEEGDLVPQPVDPNRLGYTFLGWYTSMAFTEEWLFDSMTVGDTSFMLFARWEATIFTITYNVNGGTMPDTYRDTFRAGDSFVLPAPTRYGYTFGAWYRYDEYAWSPNATTPSRPGDYGYQSLPSGIAEDLVLYAHWRAISVTVSFNVNYPEGYDDAPARPSSRSQTFGTAINLPVLANTGSHEFIGWNTAADGNGIFLVNGETFEQVQSLTVYAIWRAL